MDDIVARLTPLILIVVAPAFGGFAGLVADRFEQGPFIRGGSRCDHCGAPLRPRDLVPLLSWAGARILEGGRSRCCGARLRLYHPAVELTALALAVWAAIVVREPLLAAISAALGWTLLALALIDLRTMRLPDALTLPLTAAGLALSAAGLTGPLLEHAAGALAGFALFYAVAALYRWRRGIEGLGLGDAKLLAAAGAWAGIAALPSVLLWGCLLGLAHALAAGLARGGLRGDAATPFGPALALGFWITWLHGPVVLS